MGGAAMNVVSSRRTGFRDHSLGQFDPSSGIAADLQWGTEDNVTPVQPDYGSTSTHGFPDYGGSPQYAPAPSVSVPKPPSSGVLSPYQTYGSIYNQPNTVPSAGTLPPGPAPRVNVPLTSSPSSIGLFLSNSSLISGIPNWLVIGGGVLAIPLLGGLLGGGGGRRRRR